MPGCLDAWIPGWVRSSAEGWDGGGRAVEVLPPLLLLGLGS